MLPASFIVLMICQITPNDGDDLFFFGYQVYMVSFRRKKE